jgi:hypothetical protein
MFVVIAFGILKKAIAERSAIAFLKVRKANDERSSDVRRFPSWRITFLFVRDPAAEGREVMPRESYSFLPLVHSKKTHFLDFFFQKNRKAIANYSLNFRRPAFDTARKAIAERLPIAFLQVWKAKMKNLEKIPDFKNHKISSFFALHIQ